MSSLQKFVYSLNLIIGQRGNKEEDREKLKICKHETELMDRRTLVLMQNFVNKDSAAITWNSNCKGEIVSGTELQ